MPRRYALIVICARPGMRNLSFAANVDSVAIILLRSLGGHRKGSRTINSPVSVAPS